MHPCFIVCLAISKLYLLLWYVVSNEIWLSDWMMNWKGWCDLFWSPITCHFPGGTKENHDKSQDSWLQFKPCIPKMKDIDVTAVAACSCQIHGICYHLILPGAPKYLKRAQKNCSEIWVSHISCTFKSWSFWLWCHLMM